MPNMPLIHGGVGFGQTHATSTFGTALTAGVSDAKGSVVELIAATDHDAHWIEVMVGGQTASIACSLDILIGASTEEVLIPNLTWFGRSNDAGARWLFPIFIPKGSRLSARVATNSGSAQTMQVVVALFNAGISFGGQASRVIQYGTIASSRGVNLDSGAVAHTKGTTTQITAATEHDHDWLVITVTSIDTAITAVTKMLIDVLIGASTEQVLIANWPIGAASTADIFRPDTVFHAPVFVPKGSRLSMRHQTSITTDGDRDLYVTIHGC